MWATAMMAKAASAASAPPQTNRQPLGGERGVRLRAWRAAVDGASLGGGCVRSHVRSTCPSASQMSTRAQDAQLVAWLAGTEDARVVGGGLEAGERGEVAHLGHWRRELGKRRVREQHAHRSVPRCAINADGITAATARAAAEEQRGLQREEGGRRGDEAAEEVWQRASRRVLRRPCHRASVSRPPSPRWICNGGGGEELWGVGP